MQTVKLNLIPGSVLPVVNVSQYDEKRQFALQVYEGAATYDLTGRSVQIRGTKPDGNGFSYDAQDGVVSVSNNVVTISTTQQMTAVGGHVMTELRITSGQTILGTINFIIDVENSALSDGTPISETDIPAIERDFEAALAEAEADALVAEGYAKGTQGGVPVGSGSPYYNNNAEHFKDEAEEAASDVLGKYPKIVNDYWYVWDIDQNQYVNTGVLAKGTQGDPGDPGEGVPTGGTTGQVLRKKSDDDYDTEWANGGGGASALDDLTDVSIASAADGDLLQYNGTSQEWENNAEIPNAVAALEETGAVNLLPNKSASQTINGVTFTVNSDGTITAEGTASAGTSLIISALNDGDFDFNKYKGRTLRLTGTPSSGGNNKYVVSYYYNDGSGHSTNDNGDGVDIAFSESTPSSANFNIYIWSGQHLDNVVFKPMLSDVRFDLSFDDYQPYSMTNRELTEGLNDVSTYKIIATATASSSTTYATLFGSLKTAYNNLSADQKLRAEIWQNSDGRSLIFKNFAAGVGVFQSMVSSGGKIIYYTVRLDEPDNAAYRKVEITTGGAVTNSDFGSTICTQNLYLVVK